MIKKPEEILYCSFCSKSQQKVKRLIAGPKVFICNECVDICVEIINDDKKDEATNIKK